MSISQHDQQVLESIESDLASTGPKLASMLAIFARLTAGEEMPARRAFDAPSATSGIVTGVEAPPRPAHRRRALVWVRSQAAWLAWLLAAIAVIVWALTAVRGADRGVCPATRTAACRWIPGPAGPVHHGPGSR